MERGPQYNCQQEPAYLQHDTVVSCLTAPDHCVHRAAADCPIEHPHLIAECGLFSGLFNQPPELQLTYYCDNKRHLVCLPYSRANLHRMAADLGINKGWLHVGRGKAHYDIPPQRIAEIKQRCQVVSARDILHIVKNGVLPSK